MFSVHTKPEEFKNGGSTLKTQSRHFQIPRMEGRCPKAPFSWRISVDGRPNRRKQAAFSNVSGADFSNLSTQTNCAISRFHLLSPAGFWYWINFVWTSLKRFLNRSISRGDRIWTPCLSSSSIFLNTISYFACCSSISSGYKRVKNELSARI